VCVTLLQIAFLFFNEDGPEYLVENVVMRSFNVKLNEYNKS